MKKMLRISWNVDSSPLELLGAVVLAFGLMFYINTFLGSMGGIPAFVAFAFVYYLIRTVILSGNRINHFLAMDSGKELRYIFLSFIEGYLLFWIAMRGISAFATISGWGRVQGMSLGDYWASVFGASMLEHWAYIFCFVAMLAFVFSMFPLLIIKETRKWWGYLVGDLLLQWFFTMLVIVSCMPRIDAAYRSKVTCLLDALLLLNISRRFFAVINMALVIIYACLVVLLSYLVAKKDYQPKPGKLVTNPEDFLPLTEAEIEKKKELDKKKRQVRTILVGLCAVLAGGFTIYYFFISNDSKKRYVKVAEYLTEDTVFGPMVYGSTLYVPVDVDTSLETNKALGYLATKGQNCSTRYYRLAGENILYESEDPLNLYLEVEGQENMAFLPVAMLEKKETWKEDSVFLLWDEDWKSESLYSKDATGYAICSQDLVEALEEEFGEVTYHPSDFIEYDTYFTIRGYESLKVGLQTDTNVGDWVGLILVKDGSFYYGNGENEITGKTLELLKEVLGGA